MLEYMFLAFYKAANDDVLRALNEAARERWRVLQFIGKDQEEGGIGYPSNETPRVFTGTIWLAREVTLPADASSPANPEST